jgi:hypothetical protein
MFVVVCFSKINGKLGWISLSKSHLLRVYPDKIQLLQQKNAQNNGKIWRFKGMPRTKDLVNF